MAAGANLGQKEETITIDANLDDVDKYIEMLYDDRLERKADGAKNIMMLCLVPEGLEEMLGHGTLDPCITPPQSRSSVSSPEL